MPCGAAHHRTYGNHPEPPVHDGHQAVTTWRASLCMRIPIDGLLGLHGKEAPLWPVAGALPCSPAPQRCWLSPA
jgi:hypothetical protein